MSEHPRPPEHAFRSEIVVPQSAIDANGHVNNVVFVQWMQDVAIEHFESAGASGPMRAVGGAWVVRTHRIDYLAPAFVGERLEARTWVADFSRARTMRRYEFVRIEDQKLLAHAETNWVFVDATTGRPMAIPEEIRRLF